MDVRTQTLPNPTQVLQVMAFVVVVQNVSWAYQHWDRQKFKDWQLDTLITFARCLPVYGKKINNYIDGKIAKDTNSTREETEKFRLAMGVIPTLPETTLDVSILNKRFNAMHSHYHHGSLSGAVYQPEMSTGLIDFRGLSFLQKRAWAWQLTADTNPMHSSWPVVNLMQDEVINWSQQLFHGKVNAPGILTHGGSTSIYEALAVYVMNARRNPRYCTQLFSILGLRSIRPEVIVPDTVHVSFDKAEESLNFKLVKVPVDPETGKADVCAMEDAINMNTCLLVASAPSFPSGIIDPIEEIGALAKKYGLPLHVDACLGGFISAFAEKAGFSLPICDFRVPGVTSISADIHKYGKAPKGVSVLMFRDEKYVLPQVFLRWRGGMYVTPGLLDGSRSGAVAATAWMTMCQIAEDGYVQQARDVLSLRRTLVEDIRRIDSIDVAYEPEHSVIGIRARKGQDVNLMLVASKFIESGFEVNITQNTKQQADGFHFCLTSAHLYIGFKEKFLRNLRAAVEHANFHPDEKPRGMAKMYGVMETGVKLGPFKIPGLRAIQINVPYPPVVQRQIGVAYQKAVTDLPVELEEQKRSHQSARP